MGDPSHAEAELEGDSKRIRFQAPKRKFAALAAAPSVSTRHETVARLRD